MAHVLFVCLVDTGRSQMSGPVDKLPKAANRDSAGTTPADQLHPKSSKRCAELGIDLATPTASPNCSPRAGRTSDVVVTMGCGDSALHTGKRWRLDWTSPTQRPNPSNTSTQPRDTIAETTSARSSQNELKPRRFASRAPRPRALPRADRCTATTVRQEQHFKKPSAAVQEGAAKAVHSERARSTTQSFERRARPGAPIAQVARKPASRGTTSTASLAASAAVDARPDPLASGT